MRNQQGKRFWELELFAYLCFPESSLEGAIFAKCRWTAGKHDQDYDSRRIEKEDKLYAT